MLSRTQAWRPLGRPSRGGYVERCARRNRRITAQWDPALRQDDVYTIDAWWAAVPQSPGWSKQVAFEVVAGGKVVAATTVCPKGGSANLFVKKRALIKAKPASSECRRARLSDRVILSTGPAADANRAYYLPVLL